MKPDERYAGEFRITNSFHIGNKEVVLGENMNAEDGNFYLVADYEINELFERYTNVLVSSDYVEIVKLYSQRITEAITTLESKRINISNNVITADKCIPIGNETFIGEIIVLKEDSLHPEYRNECYQIARCMGGNGARADGLGSSVFCRDFFSTEDEKFRRANVIGILKPEYYPEWLKDKLALMEEIKNNPSAFEYCGVHFLPVGVVNESFEKISRNIESDIELGMWNVNYRGRNELCKVNYHRESFYKACGNIKCDIFKCLENGKNYIPGENEMFLYNGKFKDYDASKTKAKRNKEVER